MENTPATPNTSTLTTATGETVRIFSDVCLFGADLSGADLRRINLAYTDLSDADLSNANLSDANLERASLFGANLTDASLRNANLVYADLVYADLTGANLTGADLTGADLTHADLEGVSGVQWWQGGAGGHRRRKVCCLNAPGNQTLFFADEKVDATDEAAIAAYVADCRTRWESEVGADCAAVEAAELESLIAEARRATGLTS